MVDEILITVSSPELVPERKYPDDAGADLKAAHDAMIYSGLTEMVGTGVCLQIPYHSYLKAARTVTPSGWRRGFGGGMDIRRTNHSK